MTIQHAASLPALSSLDEDDSSSQTSQPCSLESGSDHDQDNSVEIENVKEDIVEPHVGYKKVLVTGGAGFIGSHVAQYLLERGDDVVIIDELNDYYDVTIKKSNLELLRSMCPDEKRLRVYIGDICDEALMNQIFEEERPGWVCHMAARAGVRPSIQDPYVYT